MTSPARRHLEKKALAQTEQAARAPETTPAARQALPKSTLDALQAQMEIHLARIKEAKTLDDKAAMKRSFLPVYEEFVTGYVTRGEHYPNAIAVQIMIWLMDAGDIERGLSLALHLIGQRCHQLPPRFERRDLETFICDAVYDWANVQLKKGMTASPYLDALAATLCGDQWDVHPAVASKVYVMLAKHKNKEGDYAACVDLCLKAQKINPEGAGVKTLLDGARAKLAKLPSPHAGAGDSDA